MQTTKIVKKRQRKDNYGCLNMKKREYLGKTGQRIENKGTCSRPILEIKSGKLYVSSK